MTKSSLIFNRQVRIPVRTAAYRTFIRKLGRELHLATRFDVTLVDDREAQRLNRLFRKKASPTDVLSFPWNDGTEAAGAPAKAAKEFAGFMGDIVISAEAAQRNVRQEKHSLDTEILQLILHGLLHLLGYDHEIDDGEMNRLELDLRLRLGIDGEHRSAASRRLSRRGPPTCTEPIR